MFSEERETDSKPCLPRSPMKEKKTYRTICHNNTSARQKFHKSCLNLKQSPHVMRPLFTQRTGAFKHLCSQREICYMNGFSRQWRRRNGREWSNRDLTLSWALVFVDFPWATESKPMADASTQSSPSKSTDEIDSTWCCQWNMYAYTLCTINTFFLSTNLMHN